MKNIAIVHDFLTKAGGAERVLKVFADIFPKAPIFTLIHDEKKFEKIIPSSRVHASLIKKLPKFIQNRPKIFLPFLPTITEQFDLSAFDLIISSSGAFAHGVITPSKSKHICYCHSPMRYAWDWKDEYLEENNLKGLKKHIVQKILHKIRIWDQTAADRVDLYLANSHTVQKRIKKYYRQNSTVIYPPVDINRFKPTKHHEDYFLIVSTLTPYKKIDLAIRVFNKIKRKLIIIGDGSQKESLQKISNANIEFLGFKNDSVVTEYMQNCRALIFPGEDDFGITPVEAMACGKPVIAFGKGGATETIIQGKTGEFFIDQTETSFEQGLGRFFLNESNYNYLEIAKQSQQFSEENFIANIQKIIN
ncbi:glycosyltransferase [Patescibacteria group bacterium]|nr:glycosyltransferase [Patescibacteria group bacterium]